MASYGSKFRFEWKNFVLGMVAFMVVLCLPGISSPFASIIDTIRGKISGDSK